MFDSFVGWLILAGFVIFFLWGVLTLAELFIPGVYELRHGVARGEPPRISKPCQCGGEMLWVYSDVNAWACPRCRRTEAATEAELVGGGERRKGKRRASHDSSGDDLGSPF